MSWNDPEAIEQERHDADMEMARLEAVGRRADALHRRGVCTHSCGLGHHAPAIYHAQEYLEPGEHLCMDCGEVFPTFDAFVEESRRVLGI